MELFGAIRKETFVEKSTVLAGNLDFAAATTLAFSQQMITLHSSRAALTISVNMVFWPFQVMIRACNSSHSAMVRTGVSGGVVVPMGSSGGDGLRRSASVSKRGNPSFWANNGLQKAEISRNNVIFRRIAKEKWDNNSSKKGIFYQKR